MFLEETFASPGAHLQPPQRSYFGRHPVTAQNHLPHGITNTVPLLPLAELRDGLQLLSLGSHLRGVQDVLGDHTVWFLHSRVQGLSRGVACVGRPVRPGWSGLPDQIFLGLLV